MAVASRPSVLRKYVPTELVLLGREDVVQMSSTQLFGEIECLVGLRNEHDLFADTYIYGLSVQEPVPVEINVQNLHGLSDAQRCEIRGGHVYHHSLYALSSSDREKLINELTHGTLKLEVSLVRGAGFKTEHKSIKLAND